MTGELPHSPRAGKYTNTSIKPYRVTYRVRCGATTIEWQWQPSENSATNWLWQSMANRSKPSNAKGSCGGSAEVSIATFHKAQLTPRGQLLCPPPEARFLFPCANEFDLRPNYCWISYLKKKKWQENATGVKNWNKPNRTHAHSVNAWGLERGWGGGVARQSQSKRRQNL